MYLFSSAIKYANLSVVIHTCRAYYNCHDTEAISDLVKIASDKCKFDETRDQFYMNFFCFHVILKLKSDSLRHDC